MLESGLPKILFPRFFWWAVWLANVLFSFSLIYFGVPPRLRNLLFPPESCRFPGLRVVTGRFGASLKAGLWLPGDQPVIDSCAQEMGGMSRGL